MAVPRLGLRWFMLIVLVAVHVVGQGDDVEEPLHGVPRHDHSQDFSMDLESPWFSPLVWSEEESSKNGVVTVDLSDLVLTTTEEANTETILEDDNSSVAKRPRDAHTTLNNDEQSHLDNNHDVGHVDDVDRVEDAEAESKIGLVPGVQSGPGLLGGDGDLDEELHSEEHMGDQPREASLVEQEVEDDVEEEVEVGQGEGEEDDVGDIETLLLDIERPVQQASHNKGHTMGSHEAVGLPHQLPHQELTVPKKQEEDDDDENDNDDDNNNNHDDNDNDDDDDDDDDEYNEGSMTTEVDDGVIETTTNGLVDHHILVKELIMDHDDDDDMYNDDDPLVHVVDVEERDANNVIMAANGSEVDGHYRSLDEELATSWLPEEELILPRFIFPKKKKEEVEELLHHHVSNDFEEDQKRLTEQCEPLLKKLAESNAEFVRTLLTEREQYLRLINDTNNEDSTTTTTPTTTATTTTTTTRSTTTTTTTTTSASTTTTTTTTSTTTTTTSTTTTTTSTTTTTTTTAATTMTAATMTNTTSTESPSLITRVVLEHPESKTLLMTKTSLVLVEVQSRLSLKAQRTKGQVEVWQPAQAQEVRRLGLDNFDSEDMNERYLLQCLSEACSLEIKADFKRDLMYCFSIAALSSSSSMASMAIMSDMAHVMCDARCLEHGMCDSSNTCICDKGYNGRLCSILGCPNNLCGHGGQCVMKEADNEWSCECNEKFEGDGCQWPVEHVCDDNLDNDHDGLIDCHDPECCTHDACVRGQLCTTVREPQSLLDPESVVKAKHFWERVSFLLHSGEVQRYANPDLFDPKRSVLIRGRIVSGRGRGLRGVRVSHDDQLHHGFTLTRDDGLFDLLVHSQSQVVKLTLGKSPFPYQTRTFTLLPNQINHVGEFRLRSFNMETEAEQKLCASEADVEIKLAISDSASVRVHELSLSGTPLGLLHSSRHKEGSMAKVQLQIALVANSTQSKMRRPSLVTLVTHVEGRRSKSILELDSDGSLTNHTFVWDKRDVFGQKVLGQTVITFTLLSFEKPECALATKSVTVLAFDHEQDDSLVQGWRLHVHHRLDVQHRILFLADGSSFRINNGLGTDVTTLVETVEQEEATEKDGTTESNVTHVDRRSLIEAAVAMASDGEGRLFFGDVSSIYEVVDGQRAKRILRLNATTSNGHYFLAYEKRRSLLLLSAPLDRRVFKLSLDNKDKNETKEKNSTKVWTILAGTGNVCRWRSNDNCGDNGPAVDARLIFPKGLTSNAEGDVYLCDGRVLRVVYYSSQKIRTLSKMPTSHYVSNMAIFKSGLSSEHTIMLWPLDAAFDETSLSLYVLDADQLLRIGVNQRVHAVDLPHSRDSKRAVAVSVDEDGQLVVLMTDENDKKGTLITSDDQGITWRPFFNNIVHIEDVLSFALSRDHLFLGRRRGGVERRSRLYWQEMSGRLRIDWPLSNEIFVMDAEDGRHLETRSMLTDALLYTFDYDSQGKLRSITNNLRQEVSFRRSNMSNLIEIIVGENINQVVHLDDMDHLESLTDIQSGSHTSFEYNKGLVVREVNNDQVRNEIYDDNGNHLHSITSEGNTLETPKQSHRVSNASLLEELIKSSDLSLSACGTAFTFSALSVPSRSDMSTRTILLPKVVRVRKQRLEYNYYTHMLSRNFVGVNGIGKHFSVDANLVYTAEMHPRSGIQSIYDDAGNELLKMEQFFIPARRLWLPRSPFTPVLESFSSRSQLIETWKRGNLTKKWTWDDRRRISSFYFDHLQVTFKYRDNTSTPSLIQVGDAEVQSLIYDSYGRLQSLITTNNFTHTFKMQPMLGYVTLEYKPPFVSTPWIALYTHNELVKVNYGDGQWVTQRSSKSLSTNFTINNDGWRLVRTVTMDTDHNLVTETNVDVFPMKGQQRLHSTTLKRECVDLYCLHYVDHLRVRSSSFHSSSSRLELQYDVVTHSLVSSNSLVQEHSSRASLLHSALSPGFLFLVEMDALGRDRSRTLIVNGKVAVHEVNTYGDHNRLTNRHMAINGLVVDESFNYDSNLNLKSVSRDNELLFELEVHPTGLIERLRRHFFTQSRISDDQVLKLEYDCRVGSVANLGIEYDLAGNLVRRGNFEFVYNEQRQLISVINNELNVVSHFVYDDVNRVVLHLDHNQSFHFHYSRIDKPKLITHVSIGNRTSMLHYNSRDHLVAMEHLEMRFDFVFTDNFGSPELIFDGHNGRLKRVLQYDPLGRLLNNDVDSDFPFGMAMAIVDVAKSGVVIMSNGRAYDTEIGHYMTPDTSFLSKGDIVKVEELNNLYNFQMENRESGVLDNFEEWIHEVFKLPTMKSNLDQMTCGGFGTHEKVRWEKLSKLFSMASVEQTSSLWLDSLSTPPLKVHWTESLLGPNVTLSVNRADGLVRCHVTDSASASYGKIASLINGTHVDLTHLEPHVINLWVTSSNEEFIKRMDALQINEDKSTVLFREDGLVRVKLEDKQVELRLWITDAT